MAPKGIPQIEVTFRVGLDGIAEVITAHEKERMEYKLVLSQQEENEINEIIWGGQSQSQIEEDLAAIESGIALDVEVDKYGFVFLTRTTVYESINQSICPTRRLLCR